MKTVISLGHFEHYMRFYMGKLLCTQYNKQIFVQKSLGQLVKEGRKTHGVSHFGQIAHIYIETTWACEG